ncbi:carbohydrate ABC transporter permease [Candidatus Sumerlaeota bacterium]|nr:carbohydrate ABC transporter permease [Candidatus Sumerlaeota bacterium]
MKHVLRHFLLALLSMGTAFPLIWMVVSSMKSTTAIQSSPMSLPAHWSLQPFMDAWRQGDFSRHFGNSIAVSMTAVAGIILVGSMAGFALARLRLPGAPFILAVFVVGLLLPVEGILIPLHRLNEQLGIDHSRLALILPYMALELPVSVFLFRTFYLQIPREIEESARMDGCNTWQLYWRIFLPMGRQIMGVVSILAFLAVWNEFLLANFLLNDDSLRTMPSAFNAFYGRHKANYQLIFAGLSVFVLPAVAFYLAMSRMIVKSVTAGALKG